eukprot:NODE_2439_length_2212_cov_10.821583.p1 GENE.NODE_2439_length_2212_cov_10.821583~~NODE_2439_length_2212_cov_10.821583.p1  ORF type:complete len:684 (-),score=197.74 NODE_2439_length_2212_cov_10.821583:125-2176(-)
MAPSAVPRLVATVADVGTRKILVAARAAGFELVFEAAKVRTPVPPPELHKGGRIIARYTGAILRWIGRAMEGSEIYGATNFEMAQVDSWLDWGEVELSALAPAPQVIQALDALEHHLDSRVYLVGQRFTLADASIGCSVIDLQRSGAAGDLRRATKRWLGLCQAHQAFKATPVVGAAAAVAGSAPMISAARVPGSTADNGLIARYSSCVGGRTRVARILAGGTSLAGQRVTVCGWVRTKREAGRGKLAFLELTDGSCPTALQVVVSSNVPGFAELIKHGGTGASFKCMGEIVSSQGAGQSLELSCTKDEHEVVLFGGSDGAAFPLAKKAHGLEFLRTIAHLRPRTQIIGCVARIRSALAMATHDFFQSRGFQHVHTPIITASDTEGAGEMFQVTTMIGSKAVEKGKDVDFTKDFFGAPSFLTVSGQLSAENYACALTSVYTFGPTFRAEISHTSRHLAEFWMIEPEIAFAGLDDNMNCAEEYLQACVSYVLRFNRADLDFLESAFESSAGLVQQLTEIASTPFARVSYTEAVDILIQASPQAKFVKPVEWGIDLGSEHERYLTEKVTKKPTFVYNYPKEIKAFYMRINEDGKTVQAMDCLVPNIGELMGGSVREERLDELDKRLAENELDPAGYWWYRDLRKYGTVPHAGFGLGFERLIMLCTGIDNIRDVIPFPRYPGHTEF